MKVLNFIRNHKFLFVMTMLLIFANIYRFLSFSLNLGAWEILIFALLVIAFLILIIVTIIFGIVTFRRNKLSAILTPIVAVLCAYCFLFFPALPLYVKLNDQIHRNARYAFMDAVQKGELSLIKNGSYIQLPLNLPKEYRGISNRDYVIVDGGNTEFRFVISDGISGEYTAVLYGNPYTRMM